MLRPHALALALSLALMGCSSITFYPGAQVLYVQPAEAPLFAAVQVLIIIPPDPQGRELAGRLARRLAAERTRVAVLEELNLAPHAQLPGSIVVRIQTVVSQGVHVAVHTNGAVAHHPWGKAEVHVTAYDGPSGATVQYLLYEERAGTIHDAMMKVEELLFGDVAPVQASLISEIPQLSGHGLDEARTDMLEGRWLVAAEHLERHTGDTFESPAIQAAFHFALGSCYRFDAMRGEPNAAAQFQRAIESFERAAELQPRSVRYINALSATRENLSDHGVLQRQLQTLGQHRTPL